MMSQGQIKKIKKVVFILGATGTAKTKLSIDLANNFQAEIINSDKIQVYQGLDIATNKATESERNGIPHHLLGFLDRSADFTVENFCHQVQAAIHRIIDNGCIPIIVGGSNTYVKALVEDSFCFKLDEYDSCFLWLDAELSVLHRYVAKRVDEMVENGLVDEIREFFFPGIDYSRGIWRAIGVAEMENYFLAEMKLADIDAAKKKLLGAAIEEIKVNTCKLVNSQVAKINFFRKELGWELHRINATCVFQKRGVEAELAWKEMVLNPSLQIVSNFLEESANYN